MLCDYMLIKEYAVNKTMRSQRKYHSLVAQTCRHCSILVSFLAVVSFY